MARAINLRGAITNEAQCKEAEKAITDYVTGTARDVLDPITPFIIDKNYLIRTITMIDVGKVKAIVGNFLILTNASWIGDTGRFNECLTRNDIFNEVEPFKYDVFINLNSIVDATPWPYDLPTAPK